MKLNQSIEVAQANMDKIKALTEKMQIGEIDVYYVGTSSVPTCTIRFNVPQHGKAFAEIFGDEGWERDQYDIKKSIDGVVISAFDFQRHVFLPKTVSITESLAGENPEARP